MSVREEFEEQDLAVLDLGDLPRLRQEARQEVCESIKHPYARDVKLDSVTVGACPCGKKVYVKGGERK